MDRESRYRVLWCGRLSPPGPAADRHGQRGERNAEHSDALFGSAARRRIFVRRGAHQVRARLADPLTDVLATTCRESGSSQRRHVPSPTD